MLADIERGGGRASCSALDRDHQDRSRTAARSTSPRSCTTSPRAARRTTRWSARAVARKLGPALRPERGRDRDGRLAGRAPPADEQHRAEPRPLRPQDHPRLRRRRAEPGAAEAAAGADGGRHPRRRPRRLERLEGPAAARALLRDRAGGRGRPHAARRARPHRRGPGRLPRRRSPTGAPRRSSTSSAATIPTTGCAPTRASVGRARQAGGRAPSGRASKLARPRRRPTPSPPSPSCRCSRPTIPGCWRCLPAPAPPPAPTSRARTSRPRATASRSTPSCSRREFERDEDELRRGRRIAETIEQLLKGESGSSALMAKRRERAAPASAPSRWRPRCSSTTRCPTSSP